MKKLKLIFAIIVLLILFLLAGFLGFYLPSTVKVYITGTEVKRTEVSEHGEAGLDGTRDVRYIITRDAKSNETRMFRNEDTGSGWPPYFKFNSGDIAGEAANIAKTQAEATVLVKYYGLRVPMFDAYPNVLSIEVVHADYDHIPIFNIVVVVLLLSAVLFVWWKIRGFRKRRAAKKAAKASPPPPKESEVLNSEEKIESPEEKILNPEDEEA